MKRPFFVRDVVDLVYPDACAGCSSPLVGKEEWICLDCLHDLPTTDFHKMQENPVLQIFAGRAKIEKAAAYFYFEKGGTVQRLMHHFKYENQPEIGTLLGQLAGKELLKSDFLDGVDCLVPIPLHPKKLKQRGFNQSLVLAQAISDRTRIPVHFGHLTRDVFTETQTRKSRFARWKNVEKVFTIQNSAKLDGQHVLLIDDVITTGSTAEGAAIQILGLKNTKVSFFALAKASK